MWMYIALVLLMKKELWGMMQKTKQTTQMYRLLKMETHEQCLVYSYKITN
jgi:hypothetical protein